MAADIVLAASARQWPDRLHRFLLDHGGGRIVDRLMGADGAMGSRFDVLLIDDVCSFLNPRLVKTIKSRGAEVIGVYDPEDGSDAKRRLLECGIADVIESEATPGEFLEKIGQTLTHRATGDTTRASSAGTTVTIAVTGPCEGVGVTEVAISLAESLGGMVPTLLVDLDQRWPSIAQRLDLTVHPNIRTALDFALHSPDRLHASLQEVANLSVVGGRADGGQGAPISRHEMVTLIDGLSDLAEVVVADLGPVSDVDGAVFREFDTVLAVGTATPVGIGRLMKTVDRLLRNERDQSVLGVVNMVPRSRYRRSEALGELARTTPDLPVISLPYDRKLEEAVWNGTLARSNGYRRAIQAVSQVVVESLP